MNQMTEYRRWLEQADASLQDELAAMSNTDIEEAFHQNLSFGTGGLRGILGAGTNRMNVHTVAKASQGLADHIIKTVPAQKQSIAISYDSRIRSALFARTVASVFAANGILTWIYPTLMPTPCLSFAVRTLGCAAGVMITASHNPAQYNGYKVYGPDGCQITTKTAEAILAEIDRLDIFNDIRSLTFDEAVEKGMIRYVPASVVDAFIAAVQEQSLLGTAETDKNISIVYTPLNGTGREPVMRALHKAGYTNVVVVLEQEEPDGRFPTCPYPNPENDDALSLGIECAKLRGAALLLATDPDCDRVGVVVRTESGAYQRLSGNETGLLLLDYICARRRAAGMMPDDPVLIKTIVTTALAERIARCYGLHTINVLTGFKYIGEQIGFLEQQGKVESFVFGFEESCGYLSGGYVRDKDGVGAALQICEMAAYYAARSIGLFERLEELYYEYGYCFDTLHSYEFKGIDGLANMRRIMKKFRAMTDTLCNKKIENRLDYLAGVEGLPKSDVLKFVLVSGDSVVVRPSGTEPKLKLYISVSAIDKASAEEKERQLVEDIERMIRSD